MRHELTVTPAEVEHRVPSAVVVAIEADTAEDARARIDRAMGYRCPRCALPCFPPFHEERWDRRGRGAPRFVGFFCR